MDTQDLTNILTALMGTATLWMAYETRKMARASRDAFALEARPYIALDKLEITVGKEFETPGAFQIGLKLYNPGKVLITYAVREMKVRLNEMFISSSNFSSQGGVIHPNQLTTFYYPSVNAAIPANSVSKGEVSFKIEFWSIDSERHSFKATIEYYISSDTPRQIRWLYVGLPAYA